MRLSEKHTILHSFPLQQIHFSNESILFTGTILHTSCVGADFAVYDFVDEDSNWQHEGFTFKVMISVAANSFLIYDVLS